MEKMKVKCNGTERTAGYTAGAVWECEKIRIQGWCATLHWPKRCRKNNPDSRIKTHYGLQWQNSWWDTVTNMYEPMEHGSDLEICEVYCRHSKADGIWSARRATRVSSLLVTGIICKLLKMSLKKTWCCDVVRRCCTSLVLRHQLVCPWSGPHHCRHFALRFEGCWCEQRPCGIVETRLPLPRITVGVNGQPERIGETSGQAVHETGNFAK